MEYAQLSVDHVKRPPVRFEITPGAFFFFLLIRSKDINVWGLQVETASKQTEEEAEKHFNIIKSTSG